MTKKENSEEEDLESYRNVWVYNIRKENKDLEEIIMRVQTRYGMLTIVHREEQMSEKKIKEMNESLVAKHIKDFSVTKLITDKSVLESLVSLANKITEAYRLYNDNFVAGLIFEYWVLWTQVLLPYCNTFQNYDTLKQVNGFRIFEKKEIALFQQKSYALLFLLRANFKHINQVPTYRYERYYDLDSIIPVDKEKEKAFVKSWQDCFDRLKSDTANQIESLSSQFTSEFSFHGIPKVLSQTPSFFWEKSLQITRIFAQLLTRDDHARYDPANFNLTESDWKMFDSLAKFCSEKLDLEKDQMLMFTFYGYLLEENCCYFDPSSELLLSTQTLNEASSKALSIIYDEDLITYYNRKNPDQPSYQDELSAFEKHLLEKKKSSH